MITTLRTRIRSLLIASTLATVIVVAPQAAQPVAAAVPQVTTSGASITCQRFSGMVQVSIGLPATRSNPAQYAVLGVVLNEAQPGYSYGPTAAWSNFPVLYQVSGSVATSTWWNGSGWPTNHHEYTAPWNHPQRWYRATYILAWADGVHSAMFDSNQVLC